MTAPDDLNALAEARKEIERLEKLVYVPGLWRCAKCNLRLVSNTLYADSGKMTANNSPQQCVNGCGPMWRVTEREAANEQIDQNIALREELASIKAGDSVVVPADLIRFLDGAGPLQGYWFGEKRAFERGAFWWRKYLPKLAAAPKGTK